MPITHPRPPVAWMQNLSANFGASGTISVNTKFRQVDSYIIQPIYNGTLGTMQSSLYTTYVLTSKTGGKITAQLMNGSTNLSSSYSAYIWATGVM